MGTPQRKRTKTIDPNKFDSKLRNVEVTKNYHTTDSQPIHNTLPILSVS